LDELRWRLDLLARNKMNVLHLNFVDAASFTLPTRRFPRLNVPPDPRSNGVYTRAEIRQLITEAKRRHIEILPGINMPGHARYWLQQYPELRCEATRSSTWVMCVGRERTFDMIERLFDEILPLFPLDVVHIGTDELEFQDALDRVWLSWRECPHCRRRMANEGLRTVRELLYYFIRRVHEMLARRGKRLMMWNDNIDARHTEGLPRNILVHFWRVAKSGRGPHRGCSLNRLVAEGFEIVNSHYPAVYVDVHTRDDRLLTWNPERRPPVRKELRKQILGGIGCSWRGQEILPPERYLPPFLAVLGDRLWNREPIRDADAFARALPRHLFGPNAPAALENLFHLDGRIVRNAVERYDDRPGALTPLTGVSRRKAKAGIVTALRQADQWNSLDPPTAAAFLKGINEA